MDARNAVGLSVESVALVEFAANAKTNASQL